MPRLKDGQVRVSLPEGFDAAQVLHAAGLPQKWVPHVEFMVGDVCDWRKMFGRKSDEFSPHATINFRAGVPKDMVAKLTTAIVPAVFEWKDGGYYRFGVGEVGECRSYRLTEEYRERPLVRHTIESHSIWDRLRRDAKERTAQLDEQLDLIPEVHRSLCEMERQFHLTGEGLETDHRIVPFMSPGEPTRFRWYGICDYDRVHHPTGVCPKKLRPWLTVGTSTHTLHSADVSSSQFVLSTLKVIGLLEEEGRGREGKRKRRKKKENTLLSGRSSVGANEFMEGVDMLSRMLCGTFRGDVRQTVDGERDRTGLPPVSDDEIKKGLLWSLFGSWKTLLNKEVGRALVQLWPNFMNRWADCVKRMPHGELARKMQPVEAGIMIHAVAARILRERPEIRFVTIHDAVLCEQPYVEYVIRVIKEEWERLVGIAPLVKQSSLSHSR